MFLSITVFGCNLNTGFFFNFDFTDFLMVFGVGWKCNGMWSASYFFIMLTISHMAMEEAVPLVPTLIH